MPNRREASKIPQPKPGFTGHSAGLFHLLAAMNREPADSSSAERIQAALDDMVAQRRRRRTAPANPAVANSRPGPSSSPTPIPAERSSALRWILIGLLAVTVHAAGLYWYTSRKPADRDLVLVVEPAPPLHVGGVDAVTAPSAPESAPGFSPTPRAPESLRSLVGNSAGVIEHNGRVIVVTPAPSSARPAPARTAVTTTVAAPAANPPASAPEPVSRLTSRDHAKAAEDFAYHHFRYNYKVGSTNYAVTSQSVRISRTEEVTGWNRYRSTGEVGLEYYDNSGFRRTTRRFEVLTEEKDGVAQGFEITVKL